jgi:ATP-binding cassette subfamily B protein
MVFRKGNRGGLRIYGRLFFDNIATWREAGTTGLPPWAGAAKEIRVFGLAGWLSDHYRKLQMFRLMQVWAERRRIYLRPYSSTPPSASRSRRSRWRALGRAAAAGGVSLTQLALGLQAPWRSPARRASRRPTRRPQFGMIAYDGVQGFERGVAAFDEKTVQLEPRLDPRACRARDPLRGVDFHYPGSDRPVLDGLDLTLPGRTLHRHRRPQRRRQDDPRQAPRPLCTNRRAAASWSTASTSAPSASTTGAARSASSSRTSTATS